MKTRGVKKRILSVFVPHKVSPVCRTNWDLSNFPHGDSL